MERVQQAWSSWSRWRVRRAHVARRRWRDFMPQVGSLLSLVLLLAASAGCSIDPEDVGNLVDRLRSSDISYLCLLIVAVLFVLLAAGASFPGGCSISAGRARIFLAVVGVSMLFCLVAVQFMRDSCPEPAVERREDMMLSVESVESSSSMLTRTMSGEVSFGPYEDEFEERYSRLTINFMGDASFDVEVDSDGRFSNDVPFSRQTPLKVTWHGDLDEYVLWPMEIDVPATQDEEPTDISFTFRKIDDVFVRQKEEAIRAVRACEFETADVVLDGLLAALGQVDGRIPRAQAWPHNIHRDLANEVEFQSCAQDRSTFERKWRRGAIERATTPESRIYAMNAWANYSREVYRPSGRAWPDLTLSDVGLAREEYRNLLRSDLQLIRTQLDGRPVRALVSNAMDPPAIAGCLSDGQRDALRLFESTLSAELEEVNLNRMMNTISGLQRVVMPRWLLGTWIDYPRKGEGEIEIVRNRVGEVGNEFEYHYEFRRYQSDEGSGLGELTFAPKESEQCRFATVGSVPGSRFIFMIHSSGQDGLLERKPDGRKFPLKPGTLNLPGG